MRKKSELVLSFILLPLDFLAILSAFVLAYIIRVKLDGRPVAYPLGSLVYLKFFVIVIPVWIAIFALTGLYSTSIYKRRFVELGKIFVGTAGGTMFLILVDFASHNPIFPSKSIPVYGFVLSLLFVFGERLCMARLRTYLYRLGIGVQRTVLVVAR